MGDDELKLVGLKALGQEHIRKLDDIVRTACTITGDPEEHGHTSDWICDENHPFIHSPAELIARFAAQSDDTEAELQKEGE